MKVKCSQCGKTFEALVPRGLRADLVDWLCSEKCKGAWDAAIAKSSWLDRS